MSADTSRPDAAEPVDAEFEPAPDSGGSGSKSKAKKPKAAKTGKGGAPVLAQNKFKVNGSEKIWKLHQMLRDKLGRELEEGTSLFLYCNSAFAPALDERISDVATCFHVNGTLELNYAITPAWG